MVRRRGHGPTSRGFGGALLVSLQTGVSDIEVFGMPLVWLLLAGGVLGLVLGVTVRLVRTQLGGTPTRDSGRLVGDGAEVAKPFYDQSDAGEPVETDGPNETAVSNDGDEPEVPTLSGDVEDRLTAGEYREAVQMAYVETRGYLSDEIGGSVNGTHWDFYKECEAAEVGAAPESVFELTELYERAVFGQRDISAEEAERAVDRSREILDDLGAGA